MGGEKIQVINKVNAGVSEARNNGLKRAKGEYIWFIDSDDYIEENILGQIYQIISNQGADGFRLEIQYVPENIVYKSKSNKNYKVELKTVPPYKKASTAVNYIVSRNYLLKHTIQFDPSISYGEDTLWCFWVNFFHGQFIYCINPLYFYRQRAGSAMHVKTKERHIKHLNSMMAMLRTYQCAIQNYRNTLSDKEVSLLKQRVYWSTQNVLFDAVSIGKHDRLNLLNSLIEDRLYPYPILWNRLSLNYGFKNILVNIICLFFPFKWYYNSICYLYGLIQRFR